MHSAIMRAVAFCVANLLLVGVSLGQDPAAADKKYKANLDAAAKVHEESVAAAKAEYTAALKTEMTEETKKGNLEGAVAIRDKLKKVEAAAKESQSILKKLAGTSWANTNGVTFQWKEDGTLLRNGKELPCFALDLQRVAVVFSESHIDVFLFDDKLSKFEQFNTKGTGMPLFAGKRAAIK